ncbi:unnamed protein product [Polarella glacialis]|uniref:Sphingomyelin synthase-like domain-containing protein n=1 Tax=Polarella glacialis TaxID=89957 RepID=A0A813F142_POLGL|nr:unnamed protein product [Polarella glacialis]
MAAELDLACAEEGTGPEGEKLPSTLVKDIRQQLFRLRDLSLNLHVIRSAQTDLHCVAARAGFTFHFLSREYLLRLAFAVVFFLLAAYVNSLASVIAGYRTPWVVVKDLDGNLLDTSTLPDIGHDLSSALVTSLGFEVHEVTKWLEVNGSLIPDALVHFMVACTGIFIFAHPKRFQIIRRVLMILAFVFLLRALCVFVTQLPDAHPKCQAQFTSATGSYKRRPMFPHAFYRAWLVLWHPDKHITCGDMVFSGHTSVLMQCAMVVWHYCRLEELPGGPVFTKPMQILTCNRFALTERFCTLVRAATILYTAIAAILIIATRLHYTLDVALAVYLNSRSFRWYHDAASYEKLKRRKSIFLLGYGSVMQWLEAEEVIAAEAASLEVVCNSAAAPVQNTVDKSSTQEICRKRT